PYLARETKYAADSSRKKWPPTAIKQTKLPPSSCLKLFKLESFPIELPIVVLADPFPQIDISRTLPYGQLKRQVAVSENIVVEMHPRFYRIAVLPKPLAFLALKGVFVFEVIAYPAAS